MTTGADSNMIVIHCIRSKTSLPEKKCVKEKYPFSLSHESLSSTQALKRLEI